MQWKCDFNRCQRKFISTKMIPIKNKQTKKVEIQGFYIGFVVSNVDYPRIVAFDILFHWCVLDEIHFFSPSYTKSVFFRFIPSLNKNCRVNFGQILRAKDALLMRTCCAIFIGIMKWITIICCKHLEAKMRQSKRIRSVVIQSEWTVPFPQSLEFIQ